MNQKDLEPRKPLHELYPHYHKNVSNLESIDVYRVIDLWKVDHPALQHALKKVLATGQRGAKGTDQDVQEAIDSLKRYQQMRLEDSSKPNQEI